MAKNRANQICNEVFAASAHTLLPFVGKVARLKSGDCSAKLKAALNEHDN